MPLISRIRRGEQDIRATLVAARKGTRLCLEREPRLAGPIAQARRSVRRLAFHARVRAADNASTDPCLDAGRVFYVPTASLLHRTDLPYGYAPEKCPAAVVPGDWDRVDETILEIPYWTEFREAVRGERSWESTAAYHGVMRLAEAETCDWRRRILTLDGQRVLRGYETLCASMGERGCLPQHELSRRRGRGYRATNIDDISVGVGRDGELLLCQGGHRVETARALGIEAVPVWVGLRHVEWAALRTRIAAYAAAHGGKVPERLQHPDLDNIPFACDCSARYRLISAALGTSRGRLMDLAPGWGYFLHRFEKAGFDCTGFVSDRDDKYFLERLKVAGRRRFAVEDSERIGAGADHDPVAALLLLRTAAPWLSAGSEPDRLRTLIEAHRPRAIFVEGSAERDDAPPKAVTRVLQCCATAMGSPRVRSLGRIGERALFEIADDQQPDLPR